LDDVMIRKFVQGVMHGFVQSEVVIKRKANRISLVFLGKNWGGTGPHGPSPCYGTGLQIIE